MLITRKSIFTGVERTIDIDITDEQLKAWQNGMLIQNAMPNVSINDREFIMTGILKEEWDQINFEDNSL